MTEILTEGMPPKNRVATFIKFTIFLGLGIVIIWLSLRCLLYTSDAADE